MKIFTNSNILQIKKIPDSFGALFFVKGKRKMRRKDYFTLIELLVVIAIIAILAAMLLPALQQARGRGDNASCQSNCRQIATAVDMYTGDFAGYYPMSATLQGDWAFELYRKNYVATPLIFSCKTGVKPKAVGQ